MSAAPATKPRHPTGTREEWLAARHDEYGER